MDLEELCQALKKIGVQEIVLEEEYSDEGGFNVKIPVVYFQGFDSKGHFKIKARNQDFSANNL